MTADYKDIATDHIYPSTGAAKDMREYVGGLSRVIDWPIPECWLCQNGNCMQTLRDAVCIHSPRTTQ